MIWLLLIFKAILAVWLLSRSFHFLGTFLAVHALVDLLNKFQPSYYIGMISFIIIPHILIACLAELRSLKNLRYSNILSFILLSIAVVRYHYFLDNVMNYFLLYSNIVLLLTTKPIHFKRQEDLSLSIAVLMQILEIIAFKMHFPYVAINVLNAIYYIIVFLHVLHINTPILDDFFSGKKEKSKIIFTKKRQIDIKKVA